MATNHLSQSGERSERIRSAVEKNPRKMTLQLARDLGVPEVEVVRAFPPERVTELDVARWEELLWGLEALASARGVRFRCDINHGHPADAQAQNE